MEINVKMTAEEFQEFMDWRGFKERYAAELVRVQRAPKAMAASLFHAVEPIEGKPGKFKIIDQDHLGDAWDMAEEFMPKK